VEVIRIKFGLAAREKERRFVMRARPSPSLCARCVIEKIKLSAANVQFSSNRSPFVMWPCEFRTSFKSFGNQETLSSRILTFCHGFYLSFYDCASRSKSAIRTYSRRVYNLSLMLRCCGCVCGLELAASSVPFDPRSARADFRLCPRPLADFFIMFLIIRQQNTVTLRCANSGIRATWKLFGGFAHRRWLHKS
jgi:hypothetical protein